MKHLLHRQLPLVIGALSAVVLALSAAGCASDRNSGVPELDAGTDTSEPRDTGGRDIGIDVPSTSSPRLEFVSNQIQNLSADARTNLVVRYVGADDRPIEGARVSFEYDETRAAGSQLRSLSATTNDDGEAGVELRAGPLAAEFEVTASVSDGEVIPVAFIVTVVPKNDGDYVITLLYPDGAVRLQEADVLMFNSGESCASLSRVPEEIAGAFDEVRMLPLSDGTFPPVGYPNRTDDGIRDYFPVTHAVAIAFKEDTPVAMGCTDGLPLDIAPGSNTPIEIVLHDIYPSIEGEFHVINEIDVLEFLPPTVQTVIRYIGNFFSSPGHTIFDILEDFGVFDGSSLPFGIGDLIADAIDALLFEFLPPEVVAVFESGADIYDTLQHIQLQGSMIFFDDPDERGRLGECNEIILDEIIVDFDTIEMPALNMEAYGYQAAYGTFTGWISVQESGRNIGYALNVQPFGLEINYGELAVFILEAVVFPQLLGPHVDSMEAFVGSFIDCAAIADDIGWGTFETLCDSVIAAAVAGIRDYLTAQTTDVSSFYMLATPVTGTTPPTGVELLEAGLDWAPCALEVAPDGNVQRVQELGGSGPDRCVWNARFRTSEDDPVGAPVPAAFDGFRLSTRATGVCGDGR